MKLFWRILLLILAFMQVISPIFISFDEQGIGTEALTTPADYAFIIWGPIVLISLAYSIYQLLPKQQKSIVYDLLVRPLAITFTGYTLWLYAANQKWLWLTIVLFICMWLGLLVAYKHYHKYRKTLSPIGEKILMSMLGLYLGWSSIAIFANIAATLRFNQLIAPTEESLPVYIVILIGATLTAIWVQKYIKKNWFYTGTIIWAFIAVAIGAQEKGSIIISLTAIAAAFIVITFATLSTKSH